MGPKKAPPPPAAPQKKEEPIKQAQEKITPPAEMNQKISIGKRKSDCFFIVAYLGWAAAAFVLFLANCERLLPAEVNGVPFGQPICEVLDSIEGPLRPLLESHQEWGKKMFTSQADFALDVVYHVNLFFVAPFSVLLAFGFLGGCQFVKNVALIHGAVLFYSMIIIDFYAYEALNQFDVLALENVALGAFIIYGFFTIFPLVVLKRVWGEAPFSAAKVKRGFLVRFVVFLVKAVLFLWLLLASVGFYEFTVKHTTSMQHLPSVVDSSREGWERAGPLREELVVKAAAFQEYAGQKLVEGVAATKVLAADVGERVAKWVEDLQKGKGEDAPKKEPVAQPTKQAEQPKKHPEPKAAEQKPKKTSPTKPKAPPAAPPAAPKAEATPAAAKTEPPLPPQAPQPPRNVEVDAVREVCSEGQPGCDASS